VAYRGVHINRGTSCGITVLEMACESEPLAVVRSLLANGASADGKDRFGTTPLIRASRRGNTELVCMLLDHGADANGRNMFGWSAMLWPCLASPLGCLEPALA
jgi:uncharacterized protein